MHNHAGNIWIQLLPIIVIIIMAIYTYRLEK